MEELVQQLVRKNRVFVQQSSQFGERQVHLSLLQMGKSRSIMYLVDDVETINIHNIPSESLAINCNYIAGILSDFLEDTGIKPTINGSAERLLMELIR